MSRMVEMVIDSVRVSLTNQQRIVVLREVNAERYLTIWIGPYEAESITIALQEIEVARPQTHDLLKNVLSSMNARLLRIEVVSLREEVFYGNLVVEANGQIMNIDSRPSDALALAVRAHVPILVAREVLDSAGVTPEEDLRSQSSQSSQASPKPGGTSLAPGSRSKADEPESINESPSEERLSVFEDFLQNLDIGNLDDSADEDEDEDKDKPKK
jgi:bifunctional DNase/RNase